MQGARHMGMKVGGLLGLALAVGACVNTVDEGVAEGPLSSAFRETARDQGVPRDVLVAVAWVQTRFTEPEPVHDDEHAPARATLMGLPPGLHAASAEEAIAVAAAELAALARAESGALPDTLEGWRPALARYAAGDDLEVGALFASAVLDVVHDGVRAAAFTGELLVIEPRGKRGARVVQALVAGADSELVARWLPARSGHWHSGRSRTLDRVVIHTTEGSYDGAISWFRSANNPYSTSAHYVIRSADGEITQMVREADTAYHARDWNSRAIGIEHEAISSNPAWFTEEMYRSSARLVRDICDRWGIPMDRDHIVGHVEVPGNDHSDPGPHWDWDHFMTLVREGAGTPTPPPPSEPPPSEPPPSEPPPSEPPPSEPPPSEPPPSGEPTPSDPCGGVDYAGTCSGETLTWCEDATLYRFDCGSTGQSCGWQDDSVGNNCVARDEAPSDPCEGESWYGRCDGDTLIWCEDDTVRTASCESCGWQDDTIGNNCL